MVDLIVVLPKCKIHMSVSELLSTQFCDIFSFGVTKLLEIYLLFSFKLIIYTLTTGNTQVVFKLQLPLCQWIHALNRQFVRLATKYKHFALI